MADGQNIVINAFNSTFYTNTFTSKASRGQDKHRPKSLGQEKPRVELAADGKP